MLKSIRSIVTTYLCATFKKKKEARMYMRLFITTGNIVRVASN